MRIKPGMTVMAQTRNKKEAHPAYPWGGEAAPVKITGEYPFFYVGTVVPRRRRIGFGMSEPYTVTLDKRDIQTGEMIVREKKGRP